MKHPKTSPDVPGRLGLHGVQGVPGSNPGVPTIYFSETETYTRQLPRENPPLVIS